VDAETYEKSRESLVQQAQWHKSRLNELSAAIRGLDMAWTNLTPQSKEPHHVLPSPTIAISAEYDKEKPFPRLWSHKAIIIEVALRMIGNFGVSEVKGVIDQLPEYAKFAPLIQKSTISGRLKRMAGMEGHLEIVHHGTGTRPSIYRVKRRKGEALK
jgi:hypothetical protein